MRPPLSPLLLLIALLTLLICQIDAFAGYSSTSRFTSRRVARTLQKLRQEHRRSISRSSNDKGRGSSTSLYFLGTDGGILGVGAPEIALTLVVGYFVLGPSELYKLVKEAGKFIQNIRTLGTEATKSFESTMENQLELTELRKAQVELNNAFSFRRSIYTNEYDPAFSSEKSFTGEGVVIDGSDGATAAATSTVFSGDVTKNDTEGDVKSSKKRRLVRRKKKMIVKEPLDEAEEGTKEYPDLEMLEDLPDKSISEGNKSEEENRRTERLERLRNGPNASSATTLSELDWFKASEEDIASTVLNQSATLSKFESDRFRSQLSAEQWNAQIIANEDKLSPLSMVMKRLAILEEEKQAVDKRLEEEYQRRMDNEDRYYLEKRRVLENAISDIQEGLYAAGSIEASNESDGHQNMEVKEELKGVLKTPNN